MANFHYDLELASNYLPSYDTVFIFVFIQKLTLRYFSRVDLNIISYFNPSVNSNRFEFQDFKNKS